MNLDVNEALLERGVHAASGSKSSKASRTATTSQSPKPSPLNGERAGVRGETVRMLPDSIESSSDNAELVFLDSLLLSPDDGALTASHRMGRFNCLATLLLVGPAVRDFAGQLLEQIVKQPVTRQASLIASASPVAGGAVLRIAGEHVEAVGQELHRHLNPLRELLGDDPWARKW